MSVSVILFLLILLLLCAKGKEFALMFSAIMMPMLGTFGLLGNISLIFAVSCLFLILFAKDIKSYLKVRELYIFSFVAYTLLIVISAFIAQQKHYFMALQNIFAFAVIPMCTFICLQSKKNIVSFTKIAYWTCLVCVCYSFVELATFSNPIVENAIAHNLFFGELMTEIRFGFKQIQCVFSYHETAGCFFWMMAVYFTWLLLTENHVISRKRIILIIALTAICCFLTGSRSSIVSLCIGLLPIAIVNKKYIILVPIVILVCFYSMPDYFGEIYSSIVDSDSANMGSSSDMREQQLNASLFYMFNSPSGAFWGHGLGYTDEFLIGNVTDLAGGESLWFRLMIDQGILGIIVMVYIFIYSIFVSFRVNKYLPTLVLAFLCAKTMAVVPCVEVSWVFVFVIFFNMQNRMRCCTR